MLLLPGLKGDSNLVYGVPASLMVFTETRHYFQKESISRFASLREMGFSLFRDSLAARPCCFGGSMEAKPLVPAAQYVRMSTEDQQYSIANQEVAIQIYAKNHDYVVVSTYADAGKSGVAIKHRKEL